MSSVDEIVSNHRHTVNGQKRLIQIIKCTERGCNLRFKTMKTTNFDEVIRQAKEKGWKVNLSTKTAICPAHSHEGKEMSDTSVKLQSVREMSPEDRRKIFREIDENYVAKSYIDEVTDKSIGMKLTVPWAWVAKIREENFGPEGEKESREIKMLREEINKLSVKSGQIETEILRLSERSDGVLKEIAELKAKLEGYLRTHQ